VRLVLLWEEEEEWERDSDSESSNSNSLSSGMTCSDPRPLTDLEGHIRLRLFVCCWCLRARILGERFKLSEKQSFEMTTRSVSLGCVEEEEETYMNSWLSCR
jgi:hypothetical protein